MQILHHSHLPNTPHPPAPKPADSEAVGVVPSDVDLTKLFRWFWCTLKFENYCLQEGTNREWWKFITTRCHSWIHTPPAPKNLTTIHRVSLCPTWHEVAVTTVPRLCGMWRSPGKIWELLLPMWLPILIKSEHWRGSQAPGLVSGTRMMSVCREISEPLEQPWTKPLRSDLPEKRKCRQEAG